MKKKFVLLFVAILSQFTVFAQDSVLGIKFGTHKNDVKSMLENRFGEYSVHDLNGELTVYNCTFAGIEFNFVDFEFAWNNNNGISYFNSARFQKWFSPSDTEYAKKCRDIIFEKIKLKYSYYEEDKNHNGFKYYKFGLNPNDPTKVTGMIDLTRDKGKDGVERLYLIVTYFPYLPNSDLNDL
jgi:hypothetical protein